MSGAYRICAISCVRSTCVLANHADLASPNPAANLHCFVTNPSIVGFLGYSKVMQVLNWGAAYIQRSLSPQSEIAFFSSTAHCTLLTRAARPLVAFVSTT
jgi:hypothetical protein